MDEELGVRNLRDVKEILAKADVEFWLDWGTLLGAVRDGKIIEWDGDIELGATDDSWRKIFSLFPEFKREGFYIQYAQLRAGFNFTRFGIPVQIFIYQIKGEYALSPIHGGKLPRLIGQGLRVFDHLWLFPNLKIWFVPIKTKGLRHLSSFFMARKLLSNTIQGRAGIQFRQVIIPKYYFENLESIHFYEMKFNIPSNVEDYLKYHYGEDWRIPKKGWNWLRDDGTVRPLRE